MKRDEDPRVVDLHRYRRAAEARTRAKSRPQPPPQQQRPGRSEPLLGSRKNAGVLLALALLLVVALTVGPQLLR